MQEVQKLINVEVRGKIATLTSMNFELVGGNDDYKVVFDFDADWEKYPAKTALFVYGKTTIERVFEGNVCEGVAIENSSMCLVGVFAGDIATTTPALIDNIRLSIRDVATSLPQPPKEDVYNQIMELLQEAIYAHTELPVGGYKGQVLKKRSAEDYDTEWADDEGRKSEWDFVIDSFDRLGEISSMFGNVLIQCEVPRENYATISVPTAVKYLKINITVENGSDFAFGSVVGHNECVLEGGFLGYSCNISGFKEVRNTQVANATIENCAFVYNCVALDFYNCSYVELARFWGTGSGQGTPGKIRQCEHICHVTYDREDPLYIENCDIVENVSHASPELLCNITITNAKNVDTVSGFTSATYTNCKYVNPSTCQDYVTQQNAVGKVQVLTADGSFSAFDIEGISQSVTALEVAINGAEQELQMLNEGGIE